MSTRRSFMLKAAPVAVLGAVLLPVSPAVSARTVELDEAGLLEAAKRIDSIPDSALKSDEAYERWKKENLAIAPRGGIGCGLAITTGLASTAFVAAKVFKIKAAIKAAGGAKKFVDLLITGFKVAKAEGKSNAAALEFAAQEAAQSGGKEVAVAILDLISLKDVLSECFGVEL